GELLGLCTIDVRGDAADKPAEPYMPAVFMFIHYDFNKPGSNAASTIVQLTPMNLQVSQTVESFTGLKQVSLVQDFPNPGDTDPPVRLTVSLMSVEAD